MEFEIIKYISIYIRNQETGYLGIKLTKYVQIYRSKTTKCINDIKEEIHKWRDNQCSWILRLDIVVQNLTYGFSAMLITPESYFVDIKKLTLKFILRGKNPRVSNPIFKEKNQVRI